MRSDFDVMCYACRERRQYSKLMSNSGYFPGVPLPQIKDRSGPERSQLWLRYSASIQSRKRAWFLHLRHIGKTSPFMTVTR